MIPLSPPSPPGGSNINRKIPYLAVAFLFLLVIAGIPLTLHFRNIASALLLYIGIGGFLGCGLNFLVLMLTIHIALPKKYEHIVNKLSELPTKYLLTAQNIEKHVGNKQTIGLLKSVLFESLTKKETLHVMTNGIINLMEKEQVHSLLQETIENYIKESKILSAAKFLHIIKCDKIAWLIMDKVKMQIWDISNNPYRIKEFTDMIEPLKDKIDDDQMREFIIDKAKSLLNSIDLEEKIKTQLKSYSYEDIKKAFLPPTQPYINLFVIYGGAAGIIISLILWSLNFIH